MYDTIRYEVADPVATITLNRPERLNALTPQVMTELQDAVAAAEADPQVVGIVLTGAGRGFCAGADMRRLQNMSEGATVSDWQTADGKPGAFEEMGPDFQLGLLYLMAVRKPIICAINGPCAGLGFVMAMLCDIRFASTEAKFTTAFANRGLIAEHGISWILPRLVGPAHALDLLWSGRLVDATEAASMGVVNRVVAADDLLREATGYVQTLAERSAPLAIQVIKQQVYRHLSAALGDATRESLRLMKESQARADFAEGVKSFVEKRPPRFARVTTC
jgi:enoyl-CoA hydratase/carnithine racemase